MIIPRLSDRRLQRNAGRSSDKSFLRLFALGLFWLLAASGAIANTDYDPEIRLTKSVDDTSANSDGTFTTTFTLEAKNVGNEELIKLQLKDDLTFFGPGAVVAISERRILTGPLTLNPGYDGINDIRLLTFVDRLKPGKHVKLAFDVTFTAEHGHERCRFVNKAIVWTEGKYSGKNLDRSDKAPVCLPPPTPDVEIIKHATEAIANSDGTFTSTFTLEAKNVGNEELVKLQLKDDLAFFGPDAVVAISERRILTGPLTLNPDYDGINDIRLLTFVDRLKPGKHVKLAFDVTFTAERGEERCPFNNKAIVWTEGKHSGIGLDRSDKAPVCLPPTPTIQLEKTAGDVVPNDDGTYRVPITLTVTNVGDEPLNNLTLEDDLDIFDTDGQPLQVVDFVSADEAGNNDVLRLLTELPTLTADAPGFVLGTDPDNDSVTASFTLVFEAQPPECPASYLNTAETTAVGVSSATAVNDQADAPITIPSDICVVPPTPTIQLEKTAGDVVPNDDGTYRVPITLTVTNVGDEPLNNLTLEDDLDIFDTDGQPLQVVDFVSADEAGNNDVLRLLTELPTLTADAPGFVLGTDPDNDSVTASFTLVFEAQPPECPASYLNTAETTAVGVSSATAVNDQADAPITIPSDICVVPPTPTIQLEKTAGDVVPNDDGTYRVPITLTVTNVGDEPLNNLTLEDDLDIFDTDGQPLQVVDFVSADEAGNNDVLRLLTELPTLTADAPGFVLGTDPDNDSVTASFTLVFEAQPPECPASYLNTAETTAVGVSSATAVNDQADAPITIPSDICVVPPTPTIQLEKTAGDVVPNDDGTYRVPITLTVTNVGDEPLNNLTLEDDLDIFDTDGQPLQVVDFVSADEAGNNDVLRLLTELPTLTADAPGFVLGTDPDNDSVTASFTLVFEAQPPECPASYLNTAETTAVGVSSATAVNDQADAPITIPSDICVVPPTPTIQLEKTAGDVVPNDDGTYRVPITLTVTNVGDEPLNNLTLEDDLDIFDTDGQPLQVVDFVSADEAGNNDVLRLLTELPTLTADAPGFVLGTDPDNDSVTASFTLVFEAQPPECPASYLNTAETTAVGVSSATAVNDQADAPITIPSDICVVPPTPTIQLEKTAGDVVPNDDGTYRVPITLTVTNVGDEPLNNLTLEDDLDIFDTDGQPLQVVDFVSADEAGNNDVLRLLTELPTLTADAPGFVLGTDPDNDSVTASFTLVFEAQPPECPASYLNTAETTAVGVSSATAVNDQADAPITIPSDICVVPPTPTIQLEKTAGDVVPNDDGTYRVPITLTVTNVGDEPLNNLTLEDDLDIFDTDGQPLQVVDFVSADEAGNNDVLRLLTELPTLTADAPGFVLGTDPDNDSVTASFTLVFEAQPPECPASYLNTAETTAVGVSSATAVNDQADAPITIPSDICVVPPTPTIQLEKTAGDVVPNDDGTYRVPITLTVTNVGDEPLNNLTLEDDLDIFDTDGQPLQVVDFVSADEAGNNDVLRLLTELPTLTADAPGFVLGTDPDNDSVTASFTLVFEAQPPECPASYLNTAETTAVGVSSATAVNDQADAPITIPSDICVVPPTPTIQLEKTAGDVVPNDDGTYRVPITLTVTNVGDEPLNNLTLEDDLDIFDTDGQPLQVVDFVSADEAGNNDVLRLLTELPTLTADAPGFVLGTDPDNDSVTASFTLVFEAQPPECPASYLNTAETTAVGVSSATAVNDQADAPITIPSDICVVPPTPTIQLEKTAGDVVPNDDGTYRVPITLTVTNVGDEPLNNLTLEDDLDIFDTDGQPLQVVDFVSADEAGNNDVLRLLTELPTLTADAPGFVLGTDPDNDSVTASFTLVFEAQPPECPASYLNTAETTAVGVSSATAVNDQADAPITIPSDICVVPPTPTIQLEKTAGDVVPNDDGTYRVPITLTVTNVGDEPLNNLTLEDDLDIFDTDGQPLQVVDFVSADEAGNNDVLRLLTELPTLTADAPGFVLGTDPDNDSVTASFTLVFEAQPPECPASYLNTAETTAVGVSSATAVNDQADAPITIPSDICVVPPTPTIQLEKTAGDVVPNDDGTYRVPITLTVTNVGDEPLNNLTLEDDLDIFDTDGQPLQVVDFVSADEAGNNDVLRLLTELPTLTADAPGFVLGTDPDNDSVTASFTLVFEAQPPECPASYLNTAETTAVGVSSATAVNDQADAPITIPSDICVVPPTPTIQLEKTAGDVVPNDDGTYRVPITLTVTNVGDEPLNNLTLEDDLDIFDTDGQPLQVVDFVSADEAGNNDVLRLLTELPTLTADAPGFVLGTDPDNDSVTASFTLVFEAQPPECPASYLNTAETTAVGVSSATAVNDQADAPITIPSDICVVPPTPTIQLEKTAGDVVPNDDGTYRVPITLTVTNVGDEPLNNLTLEDDLDIFDTDGQPLQVVDFVSADEAGNNDVLRLLTELPTLTADAPGFVLGTDPDNDSVTASFTLVFEAQPPECPASYLNTAETTAVGVSSATAVNDQADAPITIPSDICVVPPTPTIQLEKTAGDVVPNDDGTYRVPITLTVTNVGDEPLNNLTLEDDLDIFDTDGQPLQVVDFVSADEAGNNDVLRLLTELPTLTADAPGFVLGTDPDNDSVTASFTLVFEAQPPECPASYLNTAETTAVGVSSATAVNDQADAPITIPSDICVVPPTPTIQLEKTAGDVVPNDDGTYRVPITLTVTNVGDEPLNNLTLEDDLDIFDTDGQPLQVVDFVSADEAGNNDVLRLLTELPTLTADAPGFVLGTDPDNDSVTASFTLVFEAQPPECPASYLNTAETTAVGVSSATAVNDQADAPITIPSDICVVPPTPTIQLEKTAGDVVPNDDGTYRVPITLTVTNVGDEPLNNLTLEDDLDIFDTDGQPLQVVDFVSADEAGNNDVLRLLTELPTLTADAPGFVLGTDPDNDSVTASFTLVFEAQPPECPASYLNTAETTAVGVSSATAVNDQADAPITIPSDICVVPPTPTIQLEKTAGDVVPNDDGTYRVPITLTVTNVGDEPLNNLTLEDDLDIFDTDGQPLQVVDFVSADEAGNNDVLRLLTELPTLTADAPGFVLGTDPDNDSVTASFTLVFEAQPPECPASYLNTAETTAVGVSSATAVNDQADAPITIPSDICVVPPTPTIQLEKTAGDVVPNDDGTYRVPITLTVTNVGDEPLNNLTLEDDLDIFDTDGQPLQVVDFVSADEAGNNDVLRLLTELPTLTADAPGFVLGTDPDNDSVTASFTLVFEAQPPECPASYLNTAETTAVGVSSATAVNDQADAPITIPSDICVVPPTPTIQLEKTAGDVVPNDDGTYRVPITLTVTNVGDEPLNNLTLEDDLNALFADGGELLGLAVRDVNSVDNKLTINPDYNGTTVTALLSDANTLAIGDSATVMFTLDYQLGTAAVCPGQASYDNTAQTTAVGAISARPVDAMASAQIVSVCTEIDVTKTADKAEVKRGEAIGYQISITNPTASPLIGVIITDTPPAGFQIVAESAMLVRAGDDGSLNTTDDVVSPIATSGVREIEFEAFDLAPEESVLVRYLMRVSVGAVDGQYVNSVCVKTLKRPCSTSKKTVSVVGDPIFEKTTLFGKVFDDRNGNGLQDPDKGERGIPGVRLATVSGLIIETDSEGRYHLADVDVGRFERGTNFIIKLDTTTLPEQAKLISENPRVIRLNQATMSKVNFAVKLPTGNLDYCYESCVVDDRWASHKIVNTASCVGAPPFHSDKLKARLSPSIVDSSKTDCALHKGPFPDNAVARRITVSGGHFGCSRLVAETLPGRLSDKHSEVTVYARQTGTRNKDNLPCGDEGRIQHGDGMRHSDQQVCTADIRPGSYPVGLTTDDGTELRITGFGDVIRCHDPTNDEHIIVTPFRDDTDNSVISGLRVVNDGMAPRLELQDLPDLAKTTNRIKSASVDNLFIDPRLDVLALNRAVVGSNGGLLEPIEFAIYTNYSAFIDRYELRVYGSSKDGFEKKILDTIEFYEYRFDHPHKFMVTDVDFSKYTELEYFLVAEHCPTNVEETRCISDFTNARILKLHDDGGTSTEHQRNELWGQNNLAKQNILIRGGRVRIHGDSSAQDDHIVINNSYVPVVKNETNAETTNGPVDGTYVLEQLLPSRQYEFRRNEGGGIARQTDGTISADARNIQVFGGPFGCGKVKIEVLPGRLKHAGDRIQAATVVADPERDVDRDEICAIPPGSCPGASEIKPGEIIITSQEKSCFRVTSAGDVVPVSHPKPSINRQQLVITPFRDDTDSSKVSALRVANEGSPAEQPAYPSTPATGIAIGVQENDWFAVALASLTFGQNNTSGDVSPLTADDHFDGSGYTDGRLAFYAKGKIDDKYTITAQLDTTEDELKNLSDNLKRKDPRRIFRQLDPNLYYPIYGDDSTTTTDVDTQGAFYARIDWDKNSALWGNFNTGLTDTEFMQYNRSLYGTKIAHESLTTTEFGNAKTKATLFASEAQSIAAHVTFRATGGSLYYLHDTDIVQGSEKVWVEVRRRDTEQVVERTVLLEGRDYEVDAIQGRLILSRPLSQVVSDRERSIIRSSPLEGDEVFLLVDYEYLSEFFTADSTVHGGRGKAWLGEHVAIGATTITDNRDGSDYTLQGADLTLQHSKGSYLRVEFAESQARQNNSNFVSADGGLTFEAQSSAGDGEDLGGDATAIEARVDLADFRKSLEEAPIGIADFRKALDGDLRAWWKSREAEFSTGRLGQGVGVIDKGVEMHAKFGTEIEVTASHTDLEHEHLSRERVTRLQIEGELGYLDAGVEVRHEDIDILAPATNASISDLSGSSRDGEALLIGARLGYESKDKKTSVYATGQTVADDKGIYQENDLFTVGVSTRLNDAMAISFETSDGDRGSAFTTGFDYAIENGLNFNISGGVGSGAISQFSTRYAIGEGHELYGSYAVDPDRTDAARNLLTLGQRRSFGNGIGMFTESQFGKNDRYASVGHIFGLDFDGEDDWRFSASMQASENERVGSTFERQALSFGAYRNNDDLKLSSRIEIREDDGTGVHKRQYISSSSFTRILDNDRRWLGTLNLSWTDDELNGGHDAQFVELDIGYAYRPADNDKLNLIARYGFLYDLPTEGQIKNRPDERSHLLSIEGVYEPKNRWELAAKAAIRKGEQRTLRDSGPWASFGLRMASVRARYQVTRKWDGLVEYRWLSDIDGNNERRGALVAVYRQIKNHFKVGVGFNFSDFNDDLRLDDYNNRGWYIDLIGMY